MGSASPVEERGVTALEKFRTLIKDDLSEELLKDDAFCSRWLIAREYKAEKAAVMLKNWLEWKKDYEVDQLLKWEPPEDIKKACPYEISFHDKEGRPVLLFPWAAWTPWDFIDNGRRDEYLKYMYQMLEKCVAAIRKPAKQFIVLLDSDGFSVLKHMSRVKALETNLELLRGFECRYPEMMYLAIAINCPKAFPILFSIIRPLMSARTHQKLAILDSNSDKWKKFLAQYIPEHDLPEKYGGRRKKIEENEQASSNNSIEVQVQKVT